MARQTDRMGRLSNYCGIRTQVIKLTTKESAQAQMQDGGLSYKDIADRLGCSIGVVYARAATIREKLTAALGGKNLIECVWGRGYIMRDEAGADMGYKIKAKIKKAD